MKAFVRQQDRILVRIRDVALALHGAAQHKQKLGRIQLQKLIYLSDAVCTLFSMLPPSLAHETYKHGPWDNAIQSAADCLVFRGLAAVTVRRDSIAGHSACLYAITTSGQRWAKELSASKAGAQRWAATVAVCERVDILGWRRLRRLAYAEPTFVSARQAGYGQDLKPYEFQDVTTGALLEIMRMVLSPPWSNEPTEPRFLVELFFEYLDRYDQQSPSYGSEPKVPSETQER